MIRKRAEIIEKEGAPTHKEAPLFGAHVQYVLTSCHHLIRVSSVKSELDNSLDCIVRIDGLKSGIFLRTSSFVKNTYFTPENIIKMFFKRGVSWPNVGFYLMLAYYLFCSCSWVVEYSTTHLA
ncbi:hypothetical protein TNCV_1857861 [Trichonephila clavipes]|nr:hypothetical protein TNCV_1857861 [Trichonephila clavipes]